MVEYFGNIHFDWLRKRRIFFSLSIVLLLAGMASILVQGLRYGVDFEAGARIQVRFEQEVPIDDIRGVLRAVGAPDDEVQEVRGAGSGFNVFIRIGQDVVDEDLGRGRELVTSALNQGFEGQFEIVNSESVTLYALGGILVYIAFRFEWIYGAAAVFAVFHDTLITLGFFSLFQQEINLTVIAALLTLVGYSVNDTIVVFDRVRENLRATRRMTLLDILNKSINQTMSRTILTSGLTLVAALAMYFFGGEVINNFAFALVIGVLIGTYSSVAVAAPMVMVYQNYRQRTQTGPAVARTARSG